MSPLISSSRTNTLRRPGVMVGAKLEETGVMLDEVYNGDLMFKFTLLFWRAMAGSTLLRDGKIRGAWLKVM